MAVNRKTLSGFTLVDMMVGMVVGMIIIAGATNVYITTIRSSADTLLQSKLNQELSTLMSIMSRDVIRAGINGVVSYTTPQSNIFNQVNNTALEVINSKASNTQVAWANAAAGGSCIVYTYDADLDGVVDDEDVLGFRLNNGVAEIREKGDVTNNTRHDSCNDADDSWIAVTDSRVINITNLNFAFDDSKCLNTHEPDGADEAGDVDTIVDNTEEADCYTVIPSNGSDDITVESRQITISLAGQLVSDASVSVTLQQTVKIRNDLVRVF